MRNKRWRGKKQPAPRQRHPYLWWLGGSGAGFGLLVWLVWLNVLGTLEAVPPPPAPTSAETITSRQTYHMAGQPVAQQVITTVGGVEVSNEMHHLYTDHLGSVRTVTDSGGNVLGRNHYYPYGGYRAPTTPLTSRGFTGHQHNDELGLIYMNARYYLPSAGRFLSPDTLVPNPHNPQSFNRYSYVYNNPVRYLDPTGHCGADPLGSLDPLGNSLTDNCIALRDGMQDLYGLTIGGQWTYHEMGLLEGAIDDMLAGFGGVEGFRAMYAGTQVMRYREAGRAEVSWPLHEIQVRDDPLNQGDAFARWIFIHEFGHRLDVRTGLTASKALESHTGSQTMGFGCGLPGGDLMGHCGWSPSEGTVSDYAADNNRREDWGESFAAAHFGGDWTALTQSNSHDIKSDALTVGAGRIDFVRQQITSLLVSMDAAPSWGEP